MQTIDQAVRDLQLRGTFQFETILHKYICNILSIYPSILRKIKLNAPDTEIKKKIGKLKFTSPSLLKVLHTSISLFGIQI